MLGELLGSSARPLNLHQMQPAFKIRGLSYLRKRSCNNCASARVSLQSESNGFSTPQYMRKGAGWISSGDRHHLTSN